jgi:hypothetical protein
LKRSFILLPVSKLGYGENISNAHCNPFIFIVKSKASSKILFVGEDSPMEGKGGV